MMEVNGYVGLIIFILPVLIFLMVPAVFVILAEVTKSALPNTRPNHLKNSDLAANKLNINQLLSNKFMITKKDMQHELRH